MILYHQPNKSVPLILYLLIYPAFLELTHAFVPNAPFLYSLKTLENLKVF